LREEETQVPGEPTQVLDDNDDYEAHPNGNGKRARSRSRSNSASEDDALTDQDNTSDDESSRPSISRKKTPPSKRTAVPPRSYPPNIVPFPRPTVFFPGNPTRGNQCFPPRPLQPRPIPRLSLPIPRNHPVKFYFFDDILPPIAPWPGRQRYTLARHRRLDRPDSTTTFRSPTGRTTTLVR
jgi:hypothetical protein